MLYPRDPKVHVERHEKTLKIEWKWGPSGGYVFLGLAVIILLLLIPVLSAPTVSGVPRSVGDIVMIVAILGIFSGSIGIGGLTMILNRTIIHADHERFLVRVTPFAWFRPKVVSAKEIQQFFVGGPTSTQSTASKAIYLLDGDSHYVLLASIFPSSFAAHQICHELQDWYGLEDLPVFGQTDLPHQPGPRIQKH